MRATSPSVDHHPTQRQREALVRSIPHHPTAGIPLQDRTALFRPSAGFAEAVARLDVHIDAVAAGEHGLACDDLIATDGAVQSTRELIEDAGARVGEHAFLLVLESLGGRARIDARGYPVFALLRSDRTRHVPIETGRSA